MSNNTSLTGHGAEGIYLQLPVGYTIFELSFQIAIGILGIIGNAVVCATIIRRPNVLSAMSQYLLSLAIADIGVLMFILPLTILKAQFPAEWVLGKIACLYITPCLDVFYGASVWSITTIAVERYANIAWKEIQIGGRRSLKRSRLIIMAIWLASFATLSIPVYFHREYDSNLRRCYNSISANTHRSLVTMNSILNYILPLSIIAFCYQRIGKMVSKRLKKFQGETANQSEARESSSMVNTNAILQQTKKTQRILRPLVILFALTMLPFNVFSLAAAYWDKLFYQSYLKILIAIVSVSTFTNSAADPLVYCVVSKEFRTEAKSLLPHCFRAHTEKRKQSSSTPSLTKTKRSRDTCESRILAHGETSF